MDSNVTTLQYTLTQHKQKEMSHAFLRALLKGKSVLNFPLLRSTGYYSYSILRSLIRADAGPRIGTTLITGGSPPLQFIVTRFSTASGLRSPGGFDSKESEDALMPNYVPRKGEPLAVKRARLLYQSRKRGMLENGLLLSTFAAAHLKDMTQSQLDLYDDIINRPSNDWQLYYWITGKEETPANYDNEVMDMLKSHAKNDQREARYRQPDL